MPAKNEGIGQLKQKEMRKSTNIDYPFMGASSQSESEIKWIELHQMFDR